MIGRPYELYAIRRYELPHSDVDAFDMTQQTQTQGCLTVLTACILYR